ncbi:hypothetical protein BVX97_03815 [bacterium E08(2017)]|nr:hypothetical protein BVX97_03815 [bacterium E08(2017)]
MINRIKQPISILAVVLSSVVTILGEEVVVTATRDPRAAERAPYYTDILDNSELRVHQVPRTLPEALSRQTATLVQKTGHGQGSPYIRGFTGFRNLLLVDGIRLNNSVFRDGPNQYWNTIDIYGLDKIEAVKGPFSVLYGSDAVGGTINAFTHGITAESAEDWSKGLYYRYSTAEESHVGRLEASGYLSEDLALTFGYTLKSYGDLEGGSDVGTQKKTGYDEVDWDVKLEYFLEHDSWLVFAHQGVDVDDAWRTHKTIYGVNWEGLSVGKELMRVLDQDRKLTYLQYHKVDIGEALDEIHAGISHHLQEEERDRVRSGDRYDRQGFDVNTLGLFLQLKSESSIGDLVYGTEYYHDDVNSFKNSLNADGSVKSTAIQGPVGDDAAYDLMGVYLQDSIRASDKLTVLLGARYDHASADADSVEDPDSGEKIQISGDWDSIVGSGRLLFGLNEDKSVNLFAGISQGFRAPNLSDLTRLDSARTDEIETPSPELDPEEFISCEIGCKLGGKNKVQGQASYFYTMIDGLIVRTPTGRLIGDEFEVTKKNGGDGYVQGVEVSGQVELSKDVSLYGMFTWMDGKVETYPTSDPVLVEEYIDRLMPPTGEIGLHWQITDRCWLEGSCKAAGDADKLSTRDESDTSRIPPGGTPGYVVGDVRAGCVVSDCLTVSLAVENIGDEDYRVHGSGLNEPGRNVILVSAMSF